jgi:hypothetical protein
VPGLDLQVAPLEESIRRGLDATRGAAGLRVPAAGGEQGDWYELPEGVAIPRPRPVRSAAG